MALTEKEDLIRSIEEENKSYKLAINLLTKEMANPAISLEQKTEKEQSFVVVKFKFNKKVKQKRETSTTQTKPPPSNINNNVPPDQKSANGYDRKHVMILGKSILKNVDGWRIGRSTKTTIKSFSGASVSDCYYFKPPLECDPNQIINHVGTNDLKYKPARDVAEKIVDLAAWKSKECPLAANCNFRADDP